MEFLKNLTLKHSKKTMITFREKQYTRWDDTDALKRMRDSDILAEKKKSGTLGDTATKMGVGAAVGGTVGSIAGGIAGMKKGGKGFLKGAKSGAKVGALLGGATAGTAAAIGNSKKQSDINFYNNRLEYAKRQAGRRERADWKSNMTQREGYTY
jgi:hypothetical protein